MKKFSKILFTIFCASTFVLAQKDESVVAQIGNDKITVKDFKLRIELSPYIPTSNKIDRHSEIDFKNDFLYSLLAEKLWAMEAERLGIVSSGKFQFYFKPLEDMFVRDALFKQEVEDKVKLSANDINAGIQKSQLKFKTKLISTNDSILIYNFYNQLSRQINFDSLSSTFNDIKSTDVEVSFGTLKDEEIEDSLYLLQIDGFTSPIKSEIGWVIFKIDNKIFTPFDLNDQKAVNDMKKVLRERRIEKRYQEYMEELLSGTEININSDPFLFIFNSIWNILKTKTVIHDSITNYSLTEQDFETAINSSTEAELNASLFQLDQNEISVKYFLSDLAFHGFNVNKIDSIVVLQKLNRRAKQFVEYQIITQEGYKRKLQLKPEVRSDLSLWQQNYLAQFYFNSMFDSMTVADNELYEYFSNEMIDSTNSKLVNLRLVTLTNLEDVSDIFEQMKEGDDFGDIIKRYGKTDSLANDEGETGLKPVLLLGDIGKIATNLEVDEIYGPIQRNNSYSIIQLIERRDEDDSVKLSFESIKDELRNSLRVQKLNAHMKTTTAALAEKYNVKINTELLDQIKVTEIPMFLHRFMGFGGRIAGVPILTPFSEWIDQSTIKKMLP